MSQRDVDARYGFGLNFTRMLLLNDDLSIPSPTDGLIGGVGPFDYSGETIAAVPFTAKIDGVETEFIVDLSVIGVVDPAAVTVDELVIELNTALTADTIPLTASADVTSGRIKVVADGTPVAIQLYGAGALIAKFGQGYGAKYLNSDTFRSFNETPVRKDGERITTTDAYGADTEVVTDGYVKGYDYAGVDTAEDWEMYATMEGVALDVDGSFESPKEGTVRPFFQLELYYVKYRQGQNREPAISGYRQKLVRRCKGLPGAGSHERGFMDGNYTVQAQTYRDTSDVLQSAWKRSELTETEYNALLLGTV